MGRPSDETDRKACWSRDEQDWGSWSSRWELALRKREGWKESRLAAGVVVSVERECRSRHEMAILKWARLILGRSRRRVARVEGRRIIPVGC